MSNFDYKSIPSKLEDLYNYCNEKYFEGTLPETVMTWTNRMVNVMALAIYRRNPIHKSVYEIRVSSELDGYPKELLSTIVHEMIHIKQYQEYRNGNESALDRKVSKSSIYNNGHGPFFHKEMNRLNKEFKELDIVSSIKDHNRNTLSSGKEIRYAVIADINLGGRDIMSLYWSKDNIFSKKEIVKGSIEGVYGHGNVKKLTFITTSDLNVEFGERLTKACFLRKNAVPKSYKKEFMDKIESYSDLQIDGVLSPASTETEANPLLKRMIFDRGERGRELLSFASLVISRSGSLYRGVTALEVLSGEHEDTPKEVVDALIDYWNSAPASVINNTPLYKKYIAVAHGAIVMDNTDSDRYPIDSDRHATIWRKIWERSGERRQTFDSFKESIKKDIGLLAKKCRPLVSQKDINDYCDAIKNPPLTKSIDEIISKVSHLEAPDKKTFMMNIKCFCKGAGIDITDGMVRKAESHWDKINPEKPVSKKEVQLSFDM